MRGLGCADCGQCNNGCAGGQGRNTDSVTSGIWGQAGLILPPKKELVADFTQWAVLFGMLLLIRGK
jgi:hypothetical protein